MQRFINRGFVYSNLLFVIFITVFGVGSQVYADELSTCRADVRSANSQEVAIIDSTLENFESMFRGINSQTSSNVNIHTIKATSGKDAIFAIGAVLDQYTGLKTVHIFSHGKDGELNIAGTHVDAELLKTPEIIYEISRWKRVFAPGADLLLYGCEVAESSYGIDFIEKLSQLSGTDVAASTNLTGIESKQGDWVLEKSTGSIDTQPFVVEEYPSTLGFGGQDHNGDAIVDSMRMITWNVIGVDSNKPETQGPDTFMIGVRISADASGLNNLVVRIIDMDGSDVFGTGFTVGDSVGDFADGIDDIIFINRTEYTGETIPADEDRDFYFNVRVNRSKLSHDQIQPFRIEAFQDDGAGVGGIAGNGILDGDEESYQLVKFSWLPDANAANTPLYLYVEKYISQARNDISDQTYPTLATADDSYPAIRIETSNGTNDYDYVDDGTNSYNPPSPITVFIGDTLHIRTEGSTATQGYPQLTLSTVFDNSIFQIIRTEQYYNVPIDVSADEYQQSLGLGDVTVFDPDPFFNSGDPNTSIYANPAGWNPATHSLMVTSAPPKAGGGPIVTDYEVIVRGTGGGVLQTLILDYSGSSFHYNADLDTGVEGVEYVRFNAVQGAIVGNVSEDIDGDGIGDMPIENVTVTLYIDADNDKDLSVGDTPVDVPVLTDVNGNYVFLGLTPDVNYVVVEGPAPGFGDIGDTDGTTNNDKNTVAVTLSRDPVIATASDLGVTGLEGLAADDLIGYQRADYVEGSPDLSLTKTVDTINPQLGGNVNFTITVTNTGVADASVIEVTDRLPSGLVYVTDDSGANYNDTTGVWTIPGGLASGASASLVITATLTASQVTNFAEITLIQDGSGNDMTDTDSTPGNNDGPDNTYGTADDGTDHTPFEDDEAAVSLEAKEADLSLVKTVDNSTPTLNSTITFTLRLTNSGPDDATNVAVTDLLPSGLGYDSHTPGQTYSSVTGVWDVGTLAAGETATLEIVATVDSGAAMVNFAEVSAVDQYDPDSTKNNDGGAQTPDEDDEAAATVIPQAADLSLIKTVDNASQDQGANVTFTLLLTNSGPNDATGVTVKDLLPSGDLIYVSDTGGGDYVPGTGIWTVGNLASGATVALQITATVNTSNTIVNFAEVTASSLPDPDSTVDNDGGAQTPDEDDEGRVVLTPGAADLSLIKSVNNPTPALGDDIVFTLTVINSGPTDATNVTIRDTLPPGLTYVSDSGSAATSYAAGPPETIDWTLATLAAGSNATLTITANVASSAQSINFAEIIASDQNDPDSTPGNGDQTPDEDDEGQVVIKPVTADLELFKTVNNPNAANGDPLIYTITVVNRGPHGVTGVTVAETISPNTRFTYGDGDATPDEPGQDYDVSDVSDTFTYDSGTGLGTWTLGDLTTGESATLTLYGTMGNTNNLTNFAEIATVFQLDGTTPMPDPDSTPGNGDQTPDEDDEGYVETGSGNTRADVELTKTVTVTDSSLNPKSNTAPLAVGDIVTYVITAYNRGPVDINNAEVTDYWPNTLLNLDSSSVSAGSVTDGDPSDGILIWDPSNAPPKMNGNTFETWTLVGTVLDQGGSTAPVLITNSAEWTGSNSADPDSTVDNGVAANEDDDDSVTVGTQTADLELSKSVNNSQPVVGEVVSFTLTVTNAGPDDATNVEVTDVLDTIAPGQLSFYIAFGQGSYDSGTGVWSVGTIRSGDSATMNIYAQVDELSTTITNYAEVTAVDQPEPGPSPDSTPNNGSTDEDDDDSVTLTPPATDLALFKLVDNNMPVLGGSVTFTLMVVNYGPQPASNVEVRDYMPTGLTITGVSDSINWSYNGVTRQGVWSVPGTIPSGSSSTFTITATVDSAPPKTNFAEIIASSLPDIDSTVDNDGGALTPDEDDEAEVSITPQSADLSLTKTVDNTAPLVGTTVSFTLTVVNAGPTATTGVKVTDPLPLNFTQTGVSFNAIATGDSFAAGEWTLGDVGVGEVHTMTVTGTVDSAVPMINFAQISASDVLDPDSTVNNNTTTTPTEDDEAVVRVTPPAADLELSKSVSATTPLVGDTVTYKLTLVNAGPDNATNVVVTDTLPAGLNNVTFASSTVDGSSQGTFVPGTGIWTIGSVPNGSLAELQFTAEVVNAAVQTNFAEVTSVDQADPDSTPGNGDQDPDEDDQASVSLDATQIDLRVDIAVTRSTPLVGETVKFTVTLTNEATDNATGVSVSTNTLPAGLTFGSASNGGILNGSDEVVWSGLNIPGNSIIQLTFTTLVTSGNLQDVVAQITAADQPDVDSIPYNGVTNGPAEDDFSDSYLPNNGGTWDDDENVVSVDGQQADLRLTKILNSLAVVDNSPSHDYYMASFTLQVDNDGPDDATNVKVEDILPSGLVYLTSSTVDGSYDPGTGIWDIGDIPNGGTVVLTVNARVNTAVAVDNYAQITDVDQPDPDSTPDDGSNGDDDDDKVTVDATLIDLSLIKTISHSTPTFSDVVTYTVTLTNDFGYDTATNIVVTEDFSQLSGLSFDPAIDVTASSGIWNGVSLWTIPSLAPGASETLTITGLVTDPSGLTNAAEITAATEFDVDSVPGNGYDTPETEAEDDWAVIRPNMGLIVGSVLDDGFGLKPDTFDGNDTPIGGVTINLYFDDGTGAPDTGAGVQQTTTTTDHYVFYAAAQNYVIVETDPVGYFSIRDQHDVDGATGAIIGDDTLADYAQVPFPNDVYNQIPLTVEGNKEYFDKNFLDLEPWIISGYVFDDSTGTTSDTFDGSDAPIQGVLLTLYKDSNGDGLFDTTVTSTTTAADGSYSFEVGPGTYRVIETNSGGYSDVTDSDGDTTSPQYNQISSSIIRGVADSTGNNFLDRLDAVATLGDFVWNDIDGDGVQDGGAETGIDGVVVFVDYNDNSMLDAGEPSATTAGGGVYSITNVNVGTWNVRVYSGVPAGYSATTTQPYSATVTAGGTISDADFGYRASGTVGDFIWNDINGDAVQDGGAETGIDGVTVFVDYNDNSMLDAGEPNATTAGGGIYSITNVNVGTWNVRVASGVPVGYSSTTAYPYSTTVTAGGTISDADFGYRISGTVGDFVWNDIDGDSVQDGGSETGINGVVVFVDYNDNSMLDAGEPSATTAGGGVYSITNVNVGTWNVRVYSGVPAGYSATTLQPYSATVTAGGTISDADFGYRAAGTVGDFIWNDIDGDGVQDGGAETGIDGVTVFVDYNDNTALDIGEPSATTAGGGVYSITNVNVGTWNVRILAGVPAGYASTTAYPYSATVTAGGTISDADFGYRISGTVGDFVWNDINGDGVQDGGSETGIDGVVVFVDYNDNSMLDAGEPSATTAGGGVYSITNVNVGTWNVRVYSGVPAGYSATTTQPYSAMVTAGGTISDADFGYRASGTIGDFIWNDINGDGVQDGGSETGIDGVTVFVDYNDNTALDIGEPSATTAGGGVYSITNVNVGTWNVRVSSGVPAGYASTTAQPYSATVSAGSTIDTADFGYRAQLPIIGLAKVVGSVTDNQNGTFNIEFSFGVANLGDVDLNNVQVSDDLSTSFPAPTTFSVQSISSSDLAVNTSFDGSLDLNLLLPVVNQLTVGETATINLVVTIAPNGEYGPFYNSAIATGEDGGGIVTTDISDEGVNPDSNANGDPTDPDEDDPTVVTLAAPIPTLSEWGMTLFIFLFTFTALFVIRRRN